MNTSLASSISLEWFRNARLGLFVHYGLYSVLGRGEWVMYHERISVKDYARLADQFHPEGFDADQVCLAAKRAGMRYVIMGARHHEGFALFDSTADPFNSARTAARRDLIAEFVRACRKHELGVGLYFSLGDWRFGIMKESDSQESAMAMRALAHAQVLELMSHYGPIDVLWYDGAWCYPSTPHDTSEDVRRFWQADSLNAKVRALQPHILINDRSGDPADFSTPENHVSAPQDVGRAWEACVTMGMDHNSGWGFFPTNPLRKSSAQVLFLLLKAVANGGNFLLNVGPDAHGIIPEWQKDILDDLGNWLGIYGESIYGVKRTDAVRDINGIDGNSCGWCVIKDEKIYFYLIGWPGKELVIPVMKYPVLDAHLLQTGQSLNVHADSDGRLILRGLPAQPIHPLASVVEMRIKRD